MLRLFYGVTLLFTLLVTTDGIASTLGRSSRLLRRTHDTPTHRQESFPVSSSGNVELGWRTEKRTSAQKPPKNVAVILRTVAPLSIDRQERLNRIAVDLFKRNEISFSTREADAIIYHLVVIVDETKVAPHSTGPELRHNLSHVIDPSRFEVYGFTEASLYEEFPNLKRYIHSPKLFPNMTKFLAMVGRLDCCGKSDMWFAQREPVLAWRHTRHDKALNFSYLWFMQDDVEFVSKPAKKPSVSHVLWDFITNVDTTSTADLYGFVTHNQNCPNHWGGAKRTAKFTEILDEMGTQKVPWVCFSDGLQRLSNAMLDAVEFENKRDCIGWFETMLQPIAWKHGLFVEQDNLSRPVFDWLSRPKGAVTSTPFPPGSICNGLPPETHISDDELLQGFLGRGTYSKLANCRTVMVHKK